MAFKAALSEMPVALLLYTLQFVMLVFATEMPDAVLVMRIPLALLLYELQFMILLLFEFMEMPMPLPVL